LGCGEVKNERKKNPWKNKKSEGILFIAVFFNRLICFWHVTMIEVSSFWLLSSRPDSRGPLQLLDLSGTNLSTHAISGRARYQRKTGDPRGA
jgi:hypothetical protein